MSRVFEFLCALILGGLLAILIGGWLVGIGTENVFKNCEKLGKSRLNDQVMICEVQK